MNDRGVCLLHDTECERWKETNEEMKKRVPIWIFKIFVTILIIFLGGANIYITKRSNEVFKVLTHHIEYSNNLLKRMSHSNREVLMNQKRVMDKLNLPFLEIPDYYGEP